MDKQRSLADVGAWKQPEIGSHSSIRHSYENVLSSAARLYSFATGKMPQTDGPIAAHQEALAADDILTLAITGRRLIATTIGLRRATSVDVRVWIKGNLPEPLPITRLINVIVHHTDLEIIRTENILKIAAGKWTMDDFMDTSRKYIDPICSVSSDQRKGIIFRLIEFVETFQKKILVPIVEVCEEHHLWLEEL